VPEDALVGAVAPATQWPPHDPTRPAAEGSTVPDGAEVSAANNPETNGDGHIESRAIPAQLQQDPDAT
jgi:hypothetical protein